MARAVRPARRKKLNLITTELSAMVDDKTSAEDDGSEAYDLDLEEEVSTDAAEVMREAVEAVEALQSDGDDQDRGDHGVLEDEAEPAGDEEARLDELEAENAQLQERALRTLADYENFRRRSQRERAELERYASLAPVREFLPILDNLERALAAAGSEDDLKRGVEMIHRQMQDLLVQLNVEQVPGVGERFDPTVHEAVVSQEDAEVDVPTVVEEMQRGYLLHDRLLRPALVRVAVPVTPAEDPEDPEDPEDNDRPDSEPEATVESA